ncbi:MAG: NAD kinase [Sphingomonadales bacterium]|jgi:NAD+ kinase
MTKSLAFIASAAEDAQKAKEQLIKRYSNCDPKQADVIVALGGDGFMLQTLHDAQDLGKPIFGMNRGTIGFLMNGYRLEELEQRIEKAEALTLHPLRMKATKIDGRTISCLAYNEVSLLRETRQAAKISITIDGKTRLEELVCDGVLLATPAGSTAYNLSAHGPILPLDSKIMALTPISAFRPRRWRGALLSEDSKVCFDILNGEKRPVSAVADQREVRDIKKVEIEQDRNISITLLFDPEHSLAERILMEQFIA